MSISPETALAYQHRGRQLWNRASKECGCTPSSLLPADFLGWLLSMLSTLKPASRRQYLASSREWLGYLKCEPSNTKDVTQSFSEAIISLSHYSSCDFSYSKKVTPRRGNTSSQKAKQFKNDDLIKLIQAAKEMSSKWAVPSVVWMTANSIVGLRPIEWKSAYLGVVDGDKVLVVVNAKNTNGRSHGKLRHLNLTKINEAELSLILKQLNIAGKYNIDDVTWSRYYNAVRLTIYHMTRKTLSNRRKYPTLYSTRHQFAANAKAADLGKSEIAALMGHAVDTTATMHYGRKKHGSGRFGVNPVADEVLRIKVRSKKEFSNKSIRR